MTKFTKDPSTHPANGPLTEERLREIAALPTKTLTDGRQIAHGVISTVRTIEVVQMARQLLASMEQEPVAYMVGDYSLLHYQDPRVDEYLDRATPLYTAPQPLTTSERAELENYRNAQQVVPEPLAGDIDADDHPLTWSYHNGWNACRAAMLQAGNSPVTPDGWVACSERMPDVGDIVLTAKDGFVNVGEMERSGANYRFFTSIASGRELPATHWQPLPAAPQQEAE